MKPSNPSRRWLLASIVDAVIACLVIAVLVKTSGRSGRLATHWDLSGTANGSMSVAAVRLSTIVIAAIAVVTVALALGRRFARSAGMRVLAGLATLLGVMVPLVNLQVAAANHGVGDWHLVRGPAAWQVFGAVAIGVVGAAAALFAIGRPTPRPVATSAPLELELGADERAVWVSSAHNHVLIGVAVAAIGCGLAVAVSTSRWVVVLPFLVAGVAVAVFSSVSVRADRDGLTIRYGMLPFVHSHHALDEIEGAEVIDVAPMQWGGWGYRGSLKALGKAAVVIRGGEGIRLVLTGDKEFAVTVDDASTGAALLNTLSRRRSTT